MSLQNFHENMVLSDGRILGFALDLEKRTARVTVELRKKQGKNRVSCRVRLLFSEVAEIYLNEDLGSAYYDQANLVQDAEGYYLSLDPADNSGLPNQTDNWIIRAAGFTLEEI